MRRRVLALLILPLLFCAAVSASDVSVFAATSTGIYGNLLIGSGIRGFGSFTPAPTPDPAPAPVPSSNPAPVNAPVSAPATTAAAPATGTTTTVNIPLSYSSTLLGSGMTYSLSAMGLASISGNPMTLASSSPLTVNNYLPQVPKGATLKGATLNLELLIGSAISTLTSSSPNPFFIPTLSGLLGSLNITISSGSVTRTISGTSVTAYDLVANGFAAQLAAGAAINITFSVNDTLTPVTSPSFFMTRGGGQSEMLAFSDSRTIAGTNALNFLTLYAYTPAPNSPAAPGGNDPLANPEPFTTALVGLGLVVIGYRRVRKRE